MIHFNAKYQHTGPVFNSSYFPESINRVPHIPQQEVSFLIISLEPPQPSSSTQHQRGIAQSALFVHFFNVYIHHGSVFWTFLTFVFSQTFCLFSDFFFPLKKVLLLQTALASLKTETSLSAFPSPVQNWIGGHLNFKVYKPKYDLQIEKNEFLDCT